MTVFRVFMDIPEVSPSPDVKPGVEVVLVVLEMVTFDPSVFVLVITSTMVETTGVGVVEGLLLGAEVFSGVEVVDGVVGEAFVSAEEEVVEAAVDDVVLGELVVVGVLDGVGDDVVDDELVEEVVLWVEGVLWSVF
jgi:hypothetical protein